MTKKKFNPVYILLAVIILLQLIWTSYVFIFQKQGNHSDEIWSYGLANSYHKPFIHYTSEIRNEDATDKDIDNMREWITGEEFKNYVTVQKGQQFSYGSVYSNQTYDYHPPLYYFLLHTVCSFFPDQFSFGYGYFLNCIFLIITQIYLFRLAKIISKSDKIALVTCFFYAGTLGALCTFIFIRMYSMLTMNVVIYLFYNARFYSDLNLKKNLPPILITAFCTFMTHYYGIALIGVFTACMCIYMLIKRYFKKMFIYGLSTLTMLGLYIASFPSAITQIFKNTRTSSSSPFEGFTQFKIFINRVTRNTLNFEISVLPTGTPQIILAALICIIILLIPICFLFRNEEWFKKFKSKLFIQLKKFPSWIKNANYIPFFILICIIAMLFVTNIQVDITEYGEYALRYLFMLFPLTCLIVVIAFTKILSVIPKINKFSSVIAFVCAIALIISGNICQNNYFLFNCYPEDIDLEETFRGKNCLCVSNDKGPWLLTCLCPYLYESDNIYVTTQGKIDEDLEEIKSKGIHIDYILTMQYDYENDNDERNRKNGAAWLNESNKIFKGMKMAALDDDGTYVEKNDKLTFIKEATTDYIQVVNDNKGVELIAYANIFNGYMYVLKCN